MTGPEHYRMAEVLLEKAAEQPKIDPLAAAYIHATLALAAAAGLGMAGPDVLTEDVYRPWEAVAGQPTCAEEEDDGLSAPEGHAPEGEP